MAEVDATLAQNGHTAEATKDTKEANEEVQESENKFQQAIAAWRSGYCCLYKAGTAG